MKDFKKKECWTYGKIKFVLHQRSRRMIDFWVLKDALGFSIFFAVAVFLPLVRAWHVFVGSPVDQSNF